MRRPLVVVTRAESPGEGLRGALAARGVESRALPTTCTAPPFDPEPLDRALAELHAFAWLVVTSAHAVAALAAHPGWRRAGTRPRVAAVGSGTAARLRETGATVDLVGYGTGGASLARTLIDAEGEGLRGARVLWPRSDQALSDLAERLEAAGARVVAPVAYRTLPARPDAIGWFVDALERGDVDAVAFLSPSAAFGLAAALEARDLGRLRRRATVASLGPTTSAALRSLGAPPQVEAPHPDPLALAEALLARLVTTEGGLR